MDLNEWWRRYDDIAIAEGWSLWDAQDEIQLQAWDGREDVVAIQDDSDAWDIVLNGTGEHHRAALALLAEQSPVEFSRLMSAKYGWGF